MKNLKIKAKLILSFMIVVVLTLAIGIVGVVSLTLAAEDTALLNARTNMVVISGNIGLNVQEQRAAYRGASSYRLMGQAAGADAAIADMDRLDKEYDEMMATLGGMLATDEGKRLHKNIGTLYAAYEAARDSFISEVRREETNQAALLSAFNGLTDPVAALVSTVTELTDYINLVTDQQAEQAAVTASSTSLTMIIIIVVALGISIALSLFIARMIAKPLSMMQAILVQVGDTGSLEFTAETISEIKKEGEYRDEIGQSIKAFTKMMDRLLYIGHRLGDVAGGDLTADIELVSENDTMGNALKKMNSSLNEMFAEINSVAQQVSTASSEIATGAQSLAQGSTEQASTVEEISASINEITEQANISVETADKTAQESQAIRNIAQEGNEKMSRLAVAVQEMSDASQSIGNVIKVIDDIAFQTNILALNAAVEAARAGEHGKGFAVVADEVRNLAGKSAEAAKETSGLISANIEKSEVGRTISQETAEALRKIVEGVEHTTESLHTIAQQSEGAKAATEQVNLAVDQVAQVVQQNSATSEQSAAASEEMSSQAQVLQQLIARFKLKESATAPGAPRMIASQSEVSAPKGYSETDGGIIF